MSRVKSSAAVIVNEMRDHAKQTRERAARVSKLVRERGYALRHFAAKIGAIREIAWANMDSYTYSIHVQLTDMKVDSMKDPQLVAVLEKLSEFMEAKSTSDYASETYAQRSFRFELNNDDITIRVCLDADLKDLNGTACRRVQVGMETRQVPKFAIECAG